MANKTVTSPFEEVTAGDTTESTLTIENHGRGPMAVVVYIETDSGNSGTIQFSVNNTIAAEHPATASGKKLPPMKVWDGVRLRWKQSNGADKFTIGY